MKLMRNILPVLLLLLPFVVKAQPKPGVVDRVVAVVGSGMIKESEVENALLQYQHIDSTLGDHSRGAVLEELMLEKMMVSQAKRDSIKVTDAEVDQEIDRRMRFYLQQFGSEKDFEAFYGKSVEAFKIELNDKVRDQLLAQKMKQKVTGDIQVSPSEVLQYFNAIPLDSLPYINAEIEAGQVVIKPTVNPELKEYTKQQLIKLRGRIMKGEIDFCTAAASYSQDPGSANNCGKYEHVTRGMFVPEFDAVMFRMKEGEISDVVETPFGYHIIELLARRGEEVDIRHILMMPPVTPADMNKAKDKLDSIANLIAIDSMTFCQAAAKFSQDDDTKYNCGLLMNPATGSTHIETADLSQVDPNPNFLLLINDMKVGEVSKPVPMQTRDAHQAYRIVYLKGRTTPHVASLKEDYQRIQDAALQTKQNKALHDWVMKRMPSTYVRINDDYLKYSYTYPWIKK